MPVNTGFGSLNIGKDAVLDVILPDNSILPLAILTSFTKKQNTKELDSKGLDGINRLASIPDTWSGDLSVDRASSVLDDYFAQVEATYFATGTLNALRITETITETNGTITQYRYDGVALAYADAGTFTGDAYVKQKLNWKASKRIKVQ
ncbi:hypothetical protein A6U86_05460 [Rhizobium sp. AC27/96]|uniref:hypothetical protein n=1 Tax=Rhizobium sp. AC27/96 TaxID=1841653 RepID=UPI000827A052|nr:hypothetical protein [Rhizobium sp. AC27/96]OCJ12470.1 hypothetical protein A6U86_05460 [Rhizobium sp. AC27/96]